MRREAAYALANADGEGELFSRGSSEDHQSRSSGSIDAQNLGEEMDLARLAQVVNDEGNITPALSTKEKFFKYVRSVGPHVGLESLLLLYLLFGGTLFHYIEAPHEIKTREHQLKAIFSLKEAFQDTVWNLTRSETAFPRDAFNKMCQEYFEKLAINIFDSYRLQYITDRHLTNRTKGDEMMWTYANSVFFRSATETSFPQLKLEGSHALYSHFLAFHYFSLRSVRKHSHRISQWSRSGASSSLEQRSDGSGEKIESLNFEEMDEEILDEDDVSDDELKIPVIMVLFVLICYCGLGGLLFQMWEGWPYFDAFYFCFITMATVGFGDLYPQESSTYIILAYIIFGLSLATMCIDLAGTEYIQKIRYLGTKMEDAKGNLTEYGTLLKTTGIEFIRTTSGKLVQVKGVLNPKQARELGLEYILSDMQFQQKNILYEPPSQAVTKLLAKSNIKILPDDITENDGLIIQNRGYDKPAFFLTKYSSPNAISKQFVPAKEHTPIIIPFVLKESQI